jgi:hypothetical protein
MEVQQWLDEYCGGGDESDRPEKFPEKYWKYVALSERPRCREEYNWPAERVDQLMALVEKVTICKESPARAIEETVIRAQAYANLSSWGKKVKRNAPYAKDTVAHIELINPRMKPINIPPRPMDELQTASIYWRCHGMANEGKFVEGSKSEWNHPLLLVPYPDRISAYMKRLGDKWMEGTLFSKKTQISGAKNFLNTSLKLL